MPESRKSEVAALIILAATVLLWFTGYVDGEYSARHVVVRSICAAVLVYQWRHDRPRDHQLVDGWFIAAMAVIGFLD